MIEDMDCQDDNSEYLSLKSLLQQWKLNNLLQHFIAQNVNVDVLKMMKSHHISELLRNFTHGDRIRFEYELEKWRYSIGNPLKNVNEVHLTQIPTSITMPYNAMTIIPRNSLSKDCETQTQTILNNKNEEDSFNSKQIYSTPSPQSNSNELPSLPTTQQQPQQKPTKPPSSLPLPPLQPATMSKNEFNLHLRKEPAIYSPRINVPTSPIRTRDPHVRGRPSADLLAQQMSIQLDAREILECCRPRGPELMKIFEINKRFRPAERVELINLFAHYFYEHSIHLPVKLSYILEQQILKLFPGERLKDYRTEKRGKIYIRLSNIKNNRRRAREAKALLKHHDKSNEGIIEDLQRISNCELSFGISDDIDMILDEDKGDNSNFSDNPFIINGTNVKQEITYEDEFQD